MEAAYNCLMRPKLDHASAVWDPQYKKNVDIIEKVQSRQHDSAWETMNEQQVFQK